MHGPGNWNEPVFRDDDYFRVDRFCGVNDPPLLRLIDSAHAFVLPSAWNEPLSRLLLEALALGTPVITWRSGGNPEHLDSGVNAFVVDGAEDLGEAIAALGEPGRAERIGNAGEQLARREFSPESVYPRLLETYSRALQHATAKDEAR